MKCLAERTAIVPDRMIASRRGGAIFKRARRMFTNDDDLTDRCAEGRQLFANGSMDRTARR